MGNRFHMNHSPGARISGDVNLDRRQYWPDHKLAEQCYEPLPANKQRKGEQANSVQEQQRAQGVSGFLGDHRVRVRPIAAGFNSPPHESVFKPGGITRQLGKRGKPKV